MRVEFAIFDRSGRLYAVWEGGLLILWRAAATLDGRTTVGGGETPERALERAIELAALGAASRRLRDELSIARAIAERLPAHARVLESAVESAE